MASAKVAKLKRHGSCKKDLAAAQDGEEEKSIQPHLKLEDLEILSTIGKFPNLAYFFGTFCT